MSDSWCTTGWVSFREQKWVNFNERQGLVNHSDASCRYLVLGTPHPHGVAVHTDTGRVSVKLTGEAYRQSATMGYWEGVDADAPPP